MQCTTPLHIRHIGGSDYDGWIYTCIYKVSFVKTETAICALTDTGGQRCGTVISRLVRLPPIACQRLFTIKLVHMENHDNCRILKSLLYLWSIANILNLFFICFYHPILCHCHPDPDFFIWKMNMCRHYLCDEYSEDQKKESGAIIGPMASGCGCKGG